MLDVNLGGRPRIEITEEQWELIDQLCSMKCTGEEIAACLKMSLDTLTTRIKEKYDIGFSEFYRQKAVLGNIALRRAQRQVAIEQLNPTLLIFLGKNDLGQSDQLQHSGGVQFTLSYKVEDDNINSDNDRIQSDENTLPDGSDSENPPSV